MLSNVATAAALSLPFCELSAQLCLCCSNVNNVGGGILSSFDPYALGVPRSNCHHANIGY